MTSHATLNPGVGPHHATTMRSGALMVSLYSWTCITLGVTVARILVASLRKLKFGIDDAAAMMGSVS